MEFLILFILIILNGIFAMSEIALVSARKVRLESAAKKGSKKARKALELVNSPDRFLSTIQIGITLIGIFIGIYSGQNFTSSLESIVAKAALLAPYAHTISVGIIVVTTTYLSLVIGELVPKRLGLSNPETIAQAVARPMNFLSKITAPFIWLLTISTNFFIKLLNIKKVDSSSITEDEIKLIIQRGTKEGEIQEVEQAIVEQVFFLGDRKIASLTTPRNSLVWIDVNDSTKAIKEKVGRRFHYTYPVADKNLDNIVGVVHIKDLFNRINQPDFSLKEHTREAFFLPEGVTVYGALARFRKSKIRYALVTNEFGNIEGIITLNDILKALVGDEDEQASEKLQIIHRTDGSYLVDGQYPFYGFLRYFNQQELYNHTKFNTLSGLLLSKFRHIPKEGDTLRWYNFEFEIMDMDRARIDKVLVTYHKTENNTTDY